MLISERIHKRILTIEIVEFIYYMNVLKFDCTFIRFIIFINNFCISFSILCIRSIIIFFNLLRSIIIRLIIIIIVMICVTVIHIMVSVFVDILYF